METAVIREKQDLTYLNWTKTRESSGTAGSFLKAYSELNGIKTYYKLSNYDTINGITGHVLAVAAAANTQGINGQVEHSGEFLAAVVHNDGNLVLGHQPDGQLLGRGHYAAGTEVIEIGYVGGAAAAQKQSGNQHGTQKAFDFHSVIVF